MRVFILTQEDAFYIPPLLEKLFSRLPEGVEVVGAAVLKGEIQANRTLRYLRFLGPLAFARQVAAYLGSRVLDLADRMVGTRRAHSVRGALRRASVAVHEPSSVNDPAFLSLLRGLGVDLVVSVACPQIVRKELLGLPEHGVINLHGALLPKYRGMLPSFWVLANGEAVTGVTVHYMSAKVDDGPIIVQREVPILPDDTLHALVLRSKVGTGADALAEAIDRIQKGTAETRPNLAEEATYYSFPTPEAVRRFRERGRAFR